MRPLVVRFGAFGDMVMLTPLLRLVAQRCGQPCDVVCSGAWSRVLYRHLPWVGSVHVIGSRKTPYWFSREQRDLVAALRLREHSPCWLLESLPKAQRLLARAGYSGAGVVHSADHDRRTDEHTVLHWLRLGLATPLGAEHWAVAGDLNPAVELRVDDGERADVASWLASLGAGWDQAPVVLVQAGSKKTMKGGKRDRASNLKYWPEQRWRQVIDGVLQARQDARVLVIGAPSEQELALELAAGFPAERVRAVADQLPLRRLLALLERAHSCISVDTGPAHAAAAMGCPLAVLFGATDPRLFRPLNPAVPCEIVSALPWTQVPPGPEAWARANTMEGIAAQAVLSAWSRLPKERPCSAR